jgi:hypothetical protein
MNSPLVVYHGNCLDGFTSAWVARLKFPGAEFLPAQYGDLPPHGMKDGKPIAEVAGRDVYILDFSYSHAALKGLAELANFVYVLDHHRIAAPELAGRYWKEGDADKDWFAAHGNLFCTYHPKKSGARLAWEHFFPGGSVPWLVRLVEDRDLWRFELPSSHELNAAIRSYTMSFLVWDQLAEVLERGAPDL